jgi:hypothetical protein
MKKKQSCNKEIAYGMALKTYKFVTNENIRKKTKWWGFKKIKGKQRRKIQELVSTIFVTTNHGNNLKIPW